MQANLLAAKKKLALVDMEWNGQEDVVRLITDASADVSAADKDGWLSLITAAVWGCEEVARLLNDSGNCALDASTDGQTPLMCAAKSGKPSSYPSAH